jgi:hypothetical protein
MDQLTRRVAARYATEGAIFCAIPMAMNAAPSGKMASLQSGLEAAFRRLEQAIDAHDRLKRVPGPKGEPEMHFTRLGGTISIPVTLKGSRKRATKITGNGDSLDAAVDDLLNGLDTWADAIT